MTEYILTNREIYPSQILDIKGVISAEIDSTYKLVLGKILMKIQLFNKK